MSQDTNKEQPTSDTVKTQLAAMSLELAQLKEINHRTTEENDALKQQNLELTSVIENDLKSDLIIRIQAASKYTPEELGQLGVAELKNIEETLSKTEAFTGTFKSIRAGNASLDHTARLTVGNLYKAGV